MGLCGMPCIISLHEVLVVLSLSMEESWLILIIVMGNGEEKTEKEPVYKIGHSKGDQARLV